MGIIAYSDQIVLRKYLPSVFGIIQTGNIGVRCLRWGLEMGQAAKAKVIVRPEVAIRTPPDDNAGGHSG